MLQIGIKEQVYMVFGIVDKPEWRYRARLQAKILFHALRRGKRELSLIQTFLKVVNVEVALAIENNQIVTVTLVVAEKEVLAVL